MKIAASTSDAAVLAELGNRLARARLDRNMSQATLAAEAGVSKRTVERIEAGHSTQVTNLLRVLRALGRLDGLDMLIPDAVPSPVQQLRLEGRSRERASRSGTRQADAGPWVWKDDP